MGGDARDWFTATSPPDTWAIIRVTPTDGQSVWVDVWHPAIFHPAHWGAANGETLTLLVHGPLAAVDVRVDAAAPPVGYTIDVSYVLPEDFTQNDAGLGIDAPAAPEDAPILALGTYTGRLEYNIVGDGIDAFRVDVPEDRYLRVDFHSVMSEVRVRIVGPSGEEAAVGAKDGSLTAAGRGDRAITLGGWGDPANEYEYRVTLSAVEVHDLAVTNVRVTPDDPAAPVREIHVDVTNLGTLAFAGGHLRVNVVGTWEVYETVYDGPLALGAGESRTITIPWNVVGYAGDLRIDALLTGHDIHPENEYVWTRSVVGATAGNVALVPLTGTLVRFYERGPGTCADNVMSDLKVITCGRS